MEWEFDDLASTTYPLYSRAVVGDLCPGPVTPLTATTGVGAELGPAWAEVYAETGLRPAPDPGAGATGYPVAVFGAYLYLNISLLRLFGVYAAGADPMAFARQYLGERPDVPRQRDERPALAATAERLRRWSETVLCGGAGPPDLGGYARAARRVAELRAGRPALPGCTDAGLAERILGLRGELRTVLRLYVQAELAAALSCELLTRTTEEAGHPGLTGEPVAGAGGAVTDAAAQVWSVAAQVGRSEQLTRLFAPGVDALAAQLDSPDNARLRSAMQPLLSTHGHTGPAEWELATGTWATDPGLLLTLLDVLRRADAEPDPATRARLRGNLAARHAGTVRDTLRGSPNALRRFENSLAAAGRWLPARQAARQAVSVLHHEQRLAARELGGRHAASGLLDDPDQIFMLLGAELADFTEQPARFGEALRMRAYDYHALAAYQPPFVTIGQPPPVVRWPKGSTTRQAAARRGLAGTAAASGSTVGPARLLRSQAQLSSVRPGDVLVLPSAGPNWVPLLPVAAAVVVDAGSALSDTAVACRDLGVPCVVAMVDATGRISQGSTLEVDGCSGVVRTLGRGDGGAPGEPIPTSPGREDPAGPRPTLRKHPRGNPA